MPVYFVYCRHTGTVVRDLDPVTHLMTRRVALITGGSRGIGASTARLLARQGYAVCISYRKDRAAADSLVDEVRETGAEIEALQADVADPGQVDALFRQCDSALGRVCALVNNAGIVGDKARLEEMATDRLERMFAVNTLGTIYCCQAAIRRMALRHGGSGGAIVNVSSVASRIGSPAEYVDYAASKGAVDTLTLGLAKELADDGIRVNALRPGIIDTDIHASGGQPDRAERLAPLIPMQRPGSVDEVAQAIVWLLSREASYTTGAILDVSGGR